MRTAEAVFGFANSRCSHRNTTHADKNDKACACGGLCTVCAAQVMEPVRSRCLCVRVPAPSHMAVQDQLALVAKKEGFSLPGDLGARVAVASVRNLRRALLMLEVAYVQHGSPLPEDTKVNPPDWEMYIAVSSHSTGPATGCLCVQLGTAMAWHTPARCPDCSYCSTAEKSWDAARPCCELRRQRHQDPPRTALIERLGPAGC